CVRRGIGRPGIIRYKYGILIPIHVIFTAKHGEIDFGFIVRSPLERAVTSQALAFKIHRAPVRATRDPGYFSRCYISPAKEWANKYARSEEHTSELQS